MLSGAVAVAVALVPAVLLFSGQARTVASDELNGPKLIGPRYFTSLLLLFRRQTDHDDGGDGCAPAETLVGVR